MKLDKSERTKKRGIQAKRKLPCWDDGYLFTLLQPDCLEIKATKMRSPCAEWPLSLNIVLLSCKLTDCTLAYRGIRSFTSRILGGQT